MYKKEQKEAKVYDDKNNSQKKKITSIKWDLELNGKDMQEMLNTM